MAVEARHLLASRRACYPMSRRPISNSTKLRLAASKSRTGEPVHAKPLTLRPDLGGEAVLQRAGRACLDHLLRNEKAALCGDAEGTPEAPALPPISQGSWNCLALLSEYDLVTAPGVAIDPGQRALVSLMPDLAKFQGERR